MTAVNGKQRTLFQTIGLVVVMGGLAWASVPFYDWFCRVTGFSGVTAVASGDSEIILESIPPQRELRLSLKNEEACLAFITKEFTFDISSLRVDGNQVQLKIVNADETILYEY